MNDKLSIVRPVDGAVVFPPTYLAARIALAKCDRIDECHEWANKALALSSYAHQANDTTLEELADRIRARAVRRVGELLHEIPPGNSNGKGRSRAAAAKSAGLTSMKKSQALSVASIPEARFESLVEGPKPPKISRLAQIGRTPRKSETDSADINRLRRFYRFCLRSKGKAFSKHHPQLRPLVENIETWCQEFLASGREEPGPST